MILHIGGSTSERERENKMQRSLGARADIRRHIYKFGSLRARAAAAAAFNFNSDIFSAGARRGRAVINYKALEREREGEGAAVVVRRNDALSLLRARMCAGDDYGLMVRYYRSGITRTRTGPCSNLSTAFPTFRGQDSPQRGRCARKKRARKSVVACRVAGA